MKPLDPHRKHLLAALEADLIGPYDPETGAEVLALPPLRWYLTGFLIPEGMAHGEQAVAGDEDEQLESGDELAPDTEGSAEPGTKQPPILPSSVGLSVLLPTRAAGDVGPDQVEVEVAWGEYLLRSTSAGDFEAAAHGPALEAGPLRVGSEVLLLGRDADVADHARARRHVLTATHPPPSHPPRCGFVRSAIRERVSGSSPSRRSTCPKDQV